jgi:hypothetical protein
MDSCSNGVENPRNPHAAELPTAIAGPTSSQRIMQTGEVRRQFRPELKDFGG